jgi:hypothetical protein
MEHIKKEGIILHVFNPSVPDSPITRYLDHFPTSLGIGLLVILFSTP